MHDSGLGDLVNEEKTNIKNRKIKLLRLIVFYLPSLYQLDF
jgi:hypothetical protein